VQLDRARAALKEAGLAFKVLDEHVETTNGHVSISAMHLAKGLEFRVVVVMACDDEIIPLQERIETVGDNADLQEVYDTERHLLYVACTRARDHLLVTGVDPVSEFLDDFARAINVAPPMGEADRDPIRRYGATTSHTGIAPATSMTPTASRPGLRAPTGTAAARPFLSPT
jgi:hypothetical protein